MGQLNSRRRFLIGSAGILAAAPSIPLLASSLELPNDSVVSSSRTNLGGAVSASTAEAAAAGADVLRRGGNAVDAAIAAFMVQTVREPGNTGLGGYGGSMILYQSATRRTHAIDFDSRTPLAFRPELYKAEQDHIHGYLAVGVPGNAAGFDLALREFGTLHWNEASAHAVDLAERGLTVSENQARAFARAAAEMDPISARAYFPTGVPSAGQTWKQTDLARLYRRLGDEGPRTFYTGDVASTIARQVQANGGILSEQDLRLYEATTAEPLRIGYRGFEVTTPAPPAAGLTVLSILKTLEQFDLSKLTPWSAEYFDLFLQASRHSWAERAQYFGDPDFVRIPVQQLLSEEAAIRRAEAIRAHKAPPALADNHPGPQHTCNVIAIDGNRNVASITATHGDDFGSRVVIDGLGLVLGHGLSRFNWNSPNPNYPAPGKRVYHNMCPVIIYRDGKPYATLGLPGGQMIVSVTAQLVLSLIDFHATPEQAVKAPRVHVTGSEPVLLSQSAPAGIADALTGKGYIVKTGRVGGYSNVAIIDPATGALSAATDAGPEGSAIL
jgi:gamma-glutamyltranspeptidase/glutathione hydrolase